MTNVLFQWPMLPECHTDEQWFQCHTVDQMTSDSNATLLTSDSSATLLTRWPVIPVPHTVDQMTSDSSATQMTSVSSATQMSSTPTLLGPPTIFPTNTGKRTWTQTVYMGAFCHKHAKALKVSEYAGTEIINKETKEFLTSVLEFAHHVHWSIKKRCIHILNDMPGEWPSPTWLMIASYHRVANRYARRMAKSYMTYDSILSQRI